MIVPNPSRKRGWRQQNVFCGLDFFRRIVLPCAESCGVLSLCFANEIKVHIKDCSLAELYRADECFCTGTMGELAGVKCVDGRTIGDGSVGPMTKRLTDLFCDLVASSGTPVTA